MTSNPKKHIIDSMLREIYGEISPPDQTAEIMKRLESGDQTLLSETRLLDQPTDEVLSDSDAYPTIRCETETAPNSFTPNWIVVAATVFFCVGLIGAMARVLTQNENGETVADNTTIEQNEEASSSLKHSQSLAVKDQRNPESTDPLLAQKENAQGDAQKSSVRPAGNSKELRNSDLLDVERLTSNPLPTFAENAERIDVLKIKSQIDSSLVKSWHVNVIEHPQTISKTEWINRIFQKVLGRNPEASELAKLDHYLAGENIPDPEIQLRIVEAIMTSDATAREFSHFWADKFLDYLTPPQNKLRTKLTDEQTALKAFLRQAFIRKDPLNKIVEQLLNANGSVDSKAIEFNGAAGFIALTGNNPNRLAENISRTFLGTELSCAKCHADLVYEQSREDYLGLVAFLQGTNVTRKQTGVSVVSETSTNRKVPGLFYYNDKSGLAVYASPLIAGHNAKLDQKNGRQSLTEQLIRSDRFAKSMVNWIWSEIYGYGLSRNGRINQTVNAPHQALMAVLAEQMVANQFDFRTALKWSVLSQSFSAGQDPKDDTLTKDIPKYGGVAFFSYVYESLEHDPIESIDRLASAYRKPEGLTTAGRLSLGVKRTNKGIEIIDQMENGVLPNGLRVDDEIPDFAKGWGVESSRRSALDRIAASTSLKRQQKIEHLYMLALQRSPTRPETAKANSLFEVNGSVENAKPRTELEVLQDLWWAIYPR